MVLLFLHSEGETEERLLYGTTIETFVILDFWRNVSLM